MLRKLFPIFLLAAELLLATLVPARALTLVMMGARGRKKGGAGAGSLKKALEEELGGGSGASAKNPAIINPRSVNQGRGQEILGVTLPAEGSLKGWEFGDGVRMVATKVGGRYYALQGECPRCGFDLWRGTLLVKDQPGFDDMPRVACPTCSTTYSFRNGKVGPTLKRGGIAGFVGNLAKTATATEAGKNAKAYIITRDESDGRAYCRER